MVDTRNVVLASKSTFTATVQKVGGRVAVTDPITVKNQIREIRSIDDIPGVNTALRVDGASLFYNANTGEYDVRSGFANVQSIYISTLYANSSAGLDGQSLLSNGNTIFWGIAPLSNNATFAYGKREENLSVNFALFSGNSNFAFISNLATFATTANNATFAYGKREENLSVNFALFSGNSNFAFISNLATFATTANNATFAYGKREENLSVNFALFSGNSNFAFNTLALDGQPASFYTNASNISTGTLAAARLANSGVVAGVYGNSIAIPVITVDQYGRLTNVSTSGSAAADSIASYTYNSGNNTFTIATLTGPVFQATINQVADFTVAGNLTVQGTTTTINTQNITANDAVITLNSGQPTPLNDIGMLMQRYSAANSTNYNVGLAWKEANTRLVFGKTAETGLDNSIAFTQEWMTITDAGDVSVSGNLVFNVIDGGTY